MQNWSQFVYGSIHVRSSRYKLASQMQWIVGLRRPDEPLINQIFTIALTGHAYYGYFSIDDTTLTLLATPFSYSPREMGFQTLPQPTHLGPRAEAQEPTARLTGALADVFEKATGILLGC